MGEPDSSSLIERAKHPLAAACPLAATCPMAATAVHSLAASSPLATTYPLPAAYPLAAGLSLAVYIHGLLPICYVLHLPLSSRFLRSTYQSLQALHRGRYDLQGTLGELGSMLGSYISTSCQVSIASCIRQHQIFLNKVD